MAKITRRISFIITLSLCFSSFAQDIIYGGNESDPYHLNLLKQALSYKTNTPYSVKKYHQKIPKKRAFIFLEQNKGIDVLSGSATKDRLNRYQAIHVPLYKGLKAWRLAIINKNMPDIFKLISDKKSLKPFSAAQFHSWNASKVLAHNDIKVVKVGTFKGLYQMLDKNRVDYLPRSILEVEKDIKRYPKLNLMVDPHLLIKYPSVSYFYVNKNETALAKTIQDGLEKAIKDGSFDRIFNQAFAKVIKQYKLKNRTVITLENPFYIHSEELERKEFWAEHWLNTIE